MVTRRIRLADHRGRDATVLLVPISQGARIERRDIEGTSVTPVRRIKGIGDTHVDSLLRRYPDPDDLARALIEADPEVDTELSGRVTGACDRVYLNPVGEIVYSPSPMEIRYAPDGTEAERRVRALRPANTVPSAPPAWSGVLIPADQVVRQYALVRTYQVMHTNSLEFDFLMGIAAYLHERESMALVGSGRNGRGPLVMERNGPKYRGFLCGKVDGEAMRLTLHLSRGRLKTPEAPG